MSSEKFGRRNMLRGAAAAAGAGLIASGSTTPAFAQATPAPTVLPQSAAGKLTVIHRTEYFEQAQTLFRATVAKFAADNGVKLDISTTNPEAFGDFLGKVSSAVKAGNPPDLAYTSTVSIPQMTLLNMVEDVSDVVAEAVSRYGNIMPGINAEKLGRIDGKWRSVPFIASTTGYFARGDKLKAKGIDPASLKTYDQIREACLAISDPDNKFWGWGCTANQSGDGFGFVISLIQAFGGHFTDKSGKIVQFDSPETVAAAKWLAETFDRKGKYARMLPPGIESWGDPSNNEAYLAGSIGYTANAFSVYAQAKREKNPVFPVTVLLPAPLGNDGSNRNGGAPGGWLTIFRGSPNIALAKKLALALLDPVNFTPMSEVAGGLFMPAYEKLWTDQLIAADPNFAIIKEQVSVKDPFIGSSWPADPNAAIDAIRAQGFVEQMAANAISRRMTPAEAVKDAHKKMVQLFEEGGMPQP